MELGHGSSATPLDQGTSTSAFRRGLSATARVLARVTRSAKSANQTPPSSDAAVGIDPEDWEHGNPTAQAFLRSAMEQEKRLKKEGRIHGL